MADIRLERGAGGDAEKTFAGVLQQQGGLGPGNEKDNDIGRRKTRVGRFWERLFATLGLAAS